MTYDNCSTATCTSLTSKEANTKRLLVYGVGKNDSLESVVLNGSPVKSYTTWKHMLERCYCKSSQIRRPTYRDCVVAEEWHPFSNFNQWFTENYFSGAQLDKDLLIPGNRIYGPATCVFIPQALNMLLHTREVCGRVYPVGVRRSSKVKGKFEAGVGLGGVRLHLGTYDTPLLAHQAWQAAKADIIERFPASDPRVRKALDLRVAQLRDDLANNRITEKL